MSLESEDPKVDELKLKEKHPSTPHFVLVHGLGGGRWCWYKIQTLMETSGYKVTSIDLKSAGADRSDPDCILTFEDYDEPLIEFFSRLPEDEKVILVGHSAGGLSVTHAIHKFAKKIRLAIFVGATMLRLGFWTEQDRKDGIPNYSKISNVSGFGMGSDQSPNSSVTEKTGLEMCSQEDRTLASMLSNGGPKEAIISARFCEDKNVDKVTRVYIKTRHDHVLKPEQQDAMIKRWPPSQVFVIESDHNPIFSAPFVLFGMLVKAEVSTHCN